MRTWILWTLVPAYHPQRPHPAHKLAGEDIVMTIRCDTREPTEMLDEITDGNWLSKSRLPQAEGGQFRPSCMGALTLVASAMAYLVADEIGCVGPHKSSATV